MNKILDQIDFPLEVASRMLIRCYYPYLKEYGLTYTQYIVLSILWKESPMTVKNLGQQMYLDTGTLTPLLMKMEEKNLILRYRNNVDKRSVIVALSKEGEALKDKLKGLPQQIDKEVNLTDVEMKQLQTLLTKLIVNE